MKISQEEVEKIAGLARLKLSTQEKEQYSRELSSVLEYFNKLKEVDTEKVEPTAQVTGLENIKREDRVENFSDMDKIKKQFSEREDGYLKVKSVFE